LARNKSDVVPACLKTNKVRDKTVIVEEGFRNIGTFTYRGEVGRAVIVLLISQQDIIMTFTMRREIREEKGQRAWLDTGEGGPLVACTLIDISPSGAKLAIDSGDQIPETFWLRLTRYGHPRFSCRTVWRSSNAIGVTIEKE
jgi:hypothetical protein